MPRRLMSDEFDPEGLDSNDYTQSFEDGEVFGPTAGLADHQSAEIEIPSPLSSDYVAIPHSPEPLNELSPKMQLLLKMNYSCQECRVQLRDRPELLHQHHPGQDKTTDDPRYTQLLCLDCHQRRDNHDFMKSKYPKVDFDYIEQMRREQHRIRK